jgi:carbon-monoxide dehydrogenase medium subunit
MIPPEFDYRRADTVEEALDALSAEDARPLAGGHALLTELKTGERSPGTLVDVDGIDALAGVDGGDPLRIGALVTYAEAAGSAPLREGAAVFAEAARAVGDPQVRNRGTVGGNLAQGDPDADLPAAAVAADATLVLRGSDGPRPVEADAFFRGANDTAVGSDELVTAVRIPRADGGAYVRKTHPATGYAMVGVAAVVDTEGEAVTAPRVAAPGGAGAPDRVTARADALGGARAAATAVAAAADRAADGLDPSALRSDTHASGEYRAGLLPRYARTAMDRAVGRATGDGPPITPEADGGDRR